jgi:hypothetical protein
MTFKMKKTVVLSALLILIYSATFSQDTDFEYYKSKEIKTLLGHNRGSGGYGALTVGYSPIDNKKAVLFGARFGWIASHSLGIGIGATGFINEFHYEPSIDREVFLAGGYGGLYIEPIFLPRFPVHLSFPVLLGGGGISYVSKESELNRNMVEDSEAFLLVEPAVELELNLTRFVRFTVGTSYRFPTSFDTGRSEFRDSNIGSIKGMSYRVTFKFGKF